MIIVNIFASLKAAYAVTMVIMWDHTIFSAQGLMQIRRRDI